MYTVALYDNKLVGYIIGYIIGLLSLFSSGAFFFYVRSRVHMLNTRQ